MAKLVDILQVEKDRQEEATWAVVHLYKTGSFYSAYEWSAWLIAVITFNDEVRMRTKDRKPLAVTRIKMANSEETFCRVGFPLKSVEKYIPTRLSYDAEDDKHIVISVELPKPTDGSEVTHERLAEAVKKWKEAQPIKQPKDKKDGDPNEDIDRQQEPGQPKPKPTKTATPQPATTAMGGGLSEDIEGIPSGVLLTPATTWADIRDFDFILWLNEQIIMLDPMENCIIVGDESDWDDIDHAKCMRFAEKGLALPIGNLTSQLYSNVYLNPFDQMIKRYILCPHYGRYVDDSDMIDPDREWLLKQVPVVREFLADELGLQLHMGKVHIQEVHKGVEFLGAFLKPYRDYVSRKTLTRIERNIVNLDLRNEQHVRSTVNSYLGVLSHSASYNLRRDVFGSDTLAKVIEIDDNFLKCA